MESKGKHSERDALDEILRRYLAENDTASGEGLMELAAESVFSESPTVTPSASREADMLNRLRKTFPEAPLPGPTSGVPPLRAGLISVGVIAVLATAFLLIFNPFSTSNETTLPHPLKNISSGNARTLAQEAAPQEADILFGIQDDLTSLQQGDGNPISILVEKDKIGTSGNGDQEKIHRGKVWQPSSGYNLSKVEDPGPLTVSPPPMAPLAANNVRTKEVLDPFPLRGLYAQTQTSSEYTFVDPKEDRLVVGKKGTVLHIPKDAFVDAQSGEAISSPVQIELKEVYRRSDYLKTNLPTVSNGRQLMSGGVVYLDATAAGRRVKLAKGKDIYIEFASRKNVDTRDMQLYAGEVNDAGDMNWVPVGGQFGKMIPLPPIEMYFDEFWCECKGAEAVWNNLQFAFSSDPGYETTWIATREFRRRMRQLRDHDFYLKGLVIYRDNVRKELWKVDQMVAAEIRKDVAQGKKKEAFAKIFDRFAQQMLAAVEPFDDRGVDLGRWDARRQLLYRQVSREETERLVRLHRLRRQAVKEIESRLLFDVHGKNKYVVGVRRGKANQAKMNPVKGFLIKELGWTNLDKAVGKNLLSGRTKDLKVRLSGEVPYSSTRTFLVYTSINSMVPGRPTTGQLFKFDDVPRKANAWIVAIGYQGGMPYLGMTSLKNAKGKIIKVKMQRTQVDEYLAALHALD
ncbi:MAG TPA: hypothetical protein ENJ82_04555 [Bacteroidetes bacterium]|nr:hypothetical protein [Bacteroidota bacterium]